MECQGIRQKLSAYMEDLLSSKEKMQVDEHLKACEKCNLVLKDLKKTVAHTRGLEEVEPPPWLSQKVMARVREEAMHKRGILRKLFYPFHIKIPIEVFATIAIIVTAFYVFRTIETGIKPAPAPSGEQVIAEGKGDLAISEPETYEHEERFILKKGSKPPLPLRTPPAPTKRIMKEAEVFDGKKEKSEDAVGLAEEEKAPEKSYRAFDTEAAGGLRKLAPEPAGMPELKRRIVNLTVYVIDTKTAGREIRKTIKELGGDTITLKSFADKSVINGKLDSEKADKLRERLKLIGEVKEEKAVADTLKGDVEIRIEIIKGQEFPGR